MARARTVDYWARAGEGEILFRKRGFPIFSIKDLSTYDLL